MANDGVATPSTTESPFNRGTVPPNEAGKRYTMSEVFQVWYDNKDEILNSFQDQTGQPLQGNLNENYKLSRPGQIYHLDLQALESSKKISSSSTSSSLQERATSEVTVPEGKLASLSIGGEDGSNNLSHSSSTFISNSSSSLPPPPGIPAPSVNPSPSTSFLTPDKIEWFYVDPSGNEQGPFNGDLMQEWLTDGYLHLDLRIRRREEVTFQSLKDLCDSVQNYIQPFRVPLPDLSFQQQQHQHHQQQHQQQHQQEQHHQQQQQQHQEQQHHQQQQQQHHHQQQQQHSQPQPQNLAHSQIHQFLSSPGSSTSMNLGAAGMRLTGSMTQPLFGGDFINHSDPFSNGLANNGGFPGPQPGLFGIDSLNFNAQPLHHHHMPSLLQQLIQQLQPVLSRTNSGWGIADNSGLIGSAPGTPVAVPSVLQQSINQPTPISPWLSGVPHSRVSSPFIPATSLSEKVEERVPDNVLEPERVNEDRKEDVKPSSLSSVTNNSDSITQQPSTSPTKQMKSVPMTKDTSGSTTKTSAASAVSPALESESNVVEHVSIPAVQAAQAAQAAQDAQDAQNAAEEKEVKSTESVQEQPTPVSSTPTLAPWAKESTPVTQPKLTLKEIQRLEAEELKKQKQIQQELNEQAARAANQAWNEEQAAALAERQPALPKTSGWATTPIQPIVSKKTLADIQREEAEAKAKANAALAASASAYGSTAVNSTRPSFASAIASSTPKDDGAWTVVPKKATVLKKTVSKTSTNATSSSKVDPQMLRSVSAARPVSSINAGAIREEFLIWARSSMTNLYPTVSKDDLLDIFLTLPAKSPDSLLLISETIYSSSATMDGRRFAKEFLERRAKVEQQVGTSNDWSSAIISSADKVPTVDEDGWSTGKKKKGRR